MPRKLPFKVLHVSGQDEGHSGKELEVHSPTTRGWMSSRFAIYPQEIVLSLPEISKVSKLQILSHQHNVSTKIEIFISFPSASGQNSLAGCKFKRLGYVSLTDNSATQHQARELKSVHLEAEGQYLKLLVHKNHVNKYNLYNQVGIVAVNVLGESYLSDHNASTNSINADELVTLYTNSGSQEPLVGGSLNYGRVENGRYISPLDDLSFDMYQDPETAQLIRKLEEKKRNAVLEERFDYAKKLKQAMADLYKVGEKLGKYEVEKRRAIEMEDYDVAKAKKVQGDEYRLHVYKQLDIYDLLELNQGISEQILVKRSPPKTLGEVTAMPLREQNILPPVSPRRPPEADTNTMLKLPAIQSSTSRKSPDRENMVVSTEPPPPIPRRISNADERPLPALKSQPLPEEDVDIQQDRFVEQEAVPGVMTEKEEREAALIIEVFGINMAQMLYSKSWKLRQESIEKIRTELDNPQETEDKPPRQVSRATLAFLQKSLSDQVFVVLNDSISLLKNLLTSYIPNNKLGKNEVVHVLDKLLPILLRRAGDNAPRARETMTNAIMDIATSKQVKGLPSFPNVLCQPNQKKQAPWRLLKSQIEIMEKLIGELGIGKAGAGFSTEKVMVVLLKGLQHHNNEVREASLHCIFEIYKVIKDPLKKFFPPDDASSRKNPLYVRLYDGFDIIDNKPTEAQRKANAKKAAEENERNKAEEIKALQAQLQALRSLAQEEVKMKANAGGETANISTNSNEASPKKAATRSKTGATPTPAAGSQEGPNKKAVPRKAGATPTPRGTKNEPSPKKAAGSVTAPSTTATTETTTASNENSAKKVAAISKESSGNKLEADALVESSSVPEPKQKDTLKTKSSIPLATPIKNKPKSAKSQMIPNDDNQEERKCIFCGEENELFTEEGLDIHYWKTCPMLKRCANCSQVVEISGMQEHLVYECDIKDKFVHCPRCREAVLKTDFEPHKKTKRCLALIGREGVSVCVLCKKPVADGDEAWKLHLLKNCSENLARLAKNKPTPTQAKTKPQVKKGNSVSKLPLRNQAKKR